MTMMKGFNVFMLNVRSLCSSVDELSVKFKGYAIISVCETWLNRSITDEMIGIPDYGIIQLDRGYGNEY